MQPAPQDNQLMSKHRGLSLKPQLRLEWRGQDGQSETEQPDHSASLGDSITSSTRIGFSVHTDGRPRSWYIDVGEDQLGNEIAFLKTEIYRSEVEPRLQPWAPLTRFPDRG